MQRGRFWFGYVGILAVGAVLAGAVGSYWWSDYGVVRDRYLANSKADARFVTDEVQTAFTSIYQNLRTLSFLPGLRAVDREGDNLSPESLTTFQQIYNNLADSVAVSEVYVLPIGFDPEKLDPATGHHEAPTLAFDQLIAPSHVAAGGDPGAAQDGSGESAVPAAQDFVGLPDDAGLPQVEIQEYRELVKQLAWLKAHYPTIDSIHGMDVPMVASPELITCDNTYFDKTHADNDRSGIIQLVPFFGPDGKLKGGVAAIMLSNAYRALLPGKDYALVNTDQGFATRSLGGGQENASAEWVKAGKPDPSLIYSESTAIKTTDPTSNWLAWSGHPNAAFEASAEAISVRNSAIGSFAGIALLTLGAMVVWYLMGRNMRAARRAAAELEGRVIERTREIQSYATAAEQATAAGETRAEEMARMCKTLMAAVAAGARGDFTQRLPAMYSQDSLNELAGIFNRLLETVNAGLVESGAVLSALARTDLTQRVNGDYEGAFLQLKQDTNAVAERLTEVITQLRRTSQAVKAATGEILAGANDLSERTTRQAATIEETSAAIEQLASAVIQNAKRVNEASGNSAEFTRSAEAGGQVMQQATTAMETITASSTRISSIIGLIDDIAFQTNLLALNASVEAERAGEAGKGFAVVAVEVRRLAHGAAEASREIKDLIDRSAGEVKSGSALVAEAANRLAAMLHAARANNGVIEAIAGESRDQAASIEEVNLAVRRLDEMTQHNAALVEQTNAAIEQTEGQAAELDRIVDLFTLAEGKTRSHLAADSVTKAQRRQQTAA